MRESLILEQCKSPRSAGKGLRSCPATWQAAPGNQPSTSELRAVCGVSGDNQPHPGISFGAAQLNQSYTRSEVERMVGVSRRQLEYWTRLRLVSPQARWGERFFSFSDLVALETIKRLAARRVPARRIRRAIVALETQLGLAGTLLSALRISTNGKEVVVQPPGLPDQVVEPLTGQFVLNFETSDLAKKVHALAARSAEEWFELGMSCDSGRESLEHAAEAYARAVEAEPGWVEARINLGTTLFQLERIEEAREQFERAVAAEPNNALAEFNLGCVLDHLGQAHEAIRHLLRAAQISPSLAEAHLNLALAYEKRGQIQEAIRHLSLYLRYDPDGPWAEFARARLRQLHSSKRPPSGKLTPFRRPH